MMMMIDPRVTVSYAIDCEELMIFESGTSMFEAVNNFMRELEYIIKFYNTTPDHELDSGAKEIKKKLLGWVEDGTIDKMREKLWAKLTSPTA